MLNFAHSWRQAVHIRCKHIFHQSCLAQCLRRSCPLCRAHFIQSTASVVNVVVAENSSTWQPLDSAGKRWQLLPHPPEREQCRQAERCRDASGLLLSDRSKTGYLGVCATGSGFVAQVWYDGNRLYLGVYKTAEEAAAVVTAKYAELHEPAIEPTESVAAMPAASGPDVDLSQWRSDTSSSGYMNVYKKKASNGNSRFEAFSESSRARQSLGVYDTAEEAAMVVSRFAISNGTPLLATCNVPAANDSPDKSTEPIATTLDSGPAGVQQANQKRPRDGGTVQGSIASQAPPNQTLVAVNKHVPTPAHSRKRTVQTVHRCVRVGTSQPLTVKCCRDNTPPEPSSAVPPIEVPQDTQHRNTRAAAAKDVQSGCEGSEDTQTDTPLVSPNRFAGTTRRPGRASLIGRHVLQKFAGYGDEVFRGSITDEFSEVFICLPNLPAITHVLVGRTGSSLSSLKTAL